MYHLLQQHVMKELQRGVDFELHSLLLEKQSLLKVHFPLALETKSHYYNPITNCLLSCLVTSYAYKFTLMGENRHFP